MKMEKLNQLKAELEKKVKRIERYENRLKQAKREYIEEVIELTEMLKKAEWEETRKEIENLMLEEAKHYSEKEKMYSGIIERTMKSIVDLEWEIKALESGLLI